MCPRFLVIKYIMMPKCIDCFLICRSAFKLLTKLPSPLYVNLLQVTASDHLLTFPSLSVITSSINGFTTLFVFKAINQRLALLFITSNLVKKTKQQQQKHALPNIWKLGPLSSLLFSPGFLDLLSTMGFGRLYLPLTLSKWFPSSSHESNLSFSSNLSNFLF